MERDRSKFNDTPSSGRPQAFSVGELLRNRMGEDRWHLALVQRAEVWDVDRMRQLLDSLLAGYPVGALLLCRTTAESKVIKRTEDSSEVATAKRGTWQLLDGQQRINSLYSMLTRTEDADSLTPRVLTARPRYGRFYLNLTIEREHSNVEGGGRGKGSLIRYIVWREGPDGPLGQGEFDDFPERDCCIDLSHWYSWAEEDSSVSVPERLARRGAETVAREIDPDFRGDLTAEQRGIAGDWLGKLAHVWTERVIPVMPVEVQEPDDILELFTRINRAGVPFHDSDIYFAAVKTFWNEAEPRLKQVVDAAWPFLTVEGALRVVSRLASRGIGRGDALPLRVERITGQHRIAMIDAMGQITADYSRAMNQTARFFTELRGRSRLGYGLRYVNHWLWDETLAWAITADDWSAGDIEAIDAYLLGGTMFGYPQVFGDAFRRLALLEALAAGTNNEPFPLRRIVGVTRDRYPDLKARRQVLTLDGDLVARWSDRSQLARANDALLMCLAQEIGLDHLGDLDVDHIFASVLQRKMWEDTRRTHHPDRWRVNEPGNKWLLDASTNRALGGRPPEEKFKQLRSWLSDPTGFRVWGEDQWSITPEEVKEFEAVFGELDDNPEHINSAMERFTSLVTVRAERLLNSALDRFPDARLFARGDVGIPPKAETQIDVALQARIAASLGLKPSGAHTVAEIWKERGGELEWAFKEATRRHARLTEAGGRAPWLWRDADRNRSGFTYFRELPYDGPSGKSRFRVGTSAWLADEEGSLMWLLVPSDSDAIDRLSALTERSKGGLAIHSDEHGAWIPLDLQPYLRWGSLADDLYQQVYEIRKVLEQTQVPGARGPIGGVELVDRLADLGVVERSTGPATSI